MTIAYSPERWRQLRSTLQDFYARRLERPIVQVVVEGRDPGRERPALAGENPTRPLQGDFWNPRYDVEDLVDAVDYHLSGREYLADAYPHTWPNFGPGVLAALCGCQVQSHPQTTWFGLEDPAEAAETRIVYDPDHPGLERIKAFYRLGHDRWRGLVQMGMTDLGGNLDVVSSFRPSEKLLLDLYDAPEHVERLTWEVHEAWWQGFEDLNAVVQPASTNPGGYSSWAGIACPEPSYMLQCDFCYMIGPEMFDRFVKPELEASCRRLSHAWYHLDGPGQLPHLDSLLQIDELFGIQWVPGDGAPPQIEWMDVFKKIRDAGKAMQIWGWPEHLPVYADALGTTRGLWFETRFSPERRDEAMGFCDRWASD
jgi:5-methyltetrahydrofolate--homocysteine methyltransferase